MRSENKLTGDFLINYPAESARVLEQMPSSHVADFLAELSVSVAVPVVSAMIPARSAACIELMDDQRSSQLLSALSVILVSRIYRLLSVARRNEILARLPEAKWKNIKRYMKFSPSAAGSLMDSSIDVLPGDIAVSEAIRRMGRFRKNIRCEVYVVDGMHRLIGAISIGKLFTAKQQARLSEVASRRSYKITATADLSSLLDHPAWLSGRSIPVIDRDNTLLGVLDYQKLQEMGMSIGADVPPNPVDNLLSLAAFYWISAAQMLVGIFSVFAKNQGEQS